MQIKKQKKPLQRRKPNLAIHKDAAEKKALTKEELNTELLVAALRDDDVKIKNLLDAGADIEVKDEEGRTALMWAAISDFTGTCALLLERGAKTEAIDNDGETALMLAANEGNAEACAMLLGKGAKVDAREGFNYETALMLAAWKGHTKVCELLIMHNARINARDSDGRSVLKIAEQGGDEQTAALLRFALLLRKTKNWKASLSDFRACISGGP